MVVFRIILLLVVFVLLLVLALTNARELTTVQVFGSYYQDVSVALVMLYSFAFGAVCVGVFTLVTEIQLRSRLRRQRREAEALLDELRAFRNAPCEAGDEAAENGGE